MDLVACAALTVLERPVVARLRLHHEPVDQHVSAGCGMMSTGLLLFLFQYLAVKYYRLVLYHKYFSPLRHLPGPTDNHFFFGQALNLMRAETPTTLYVQWTRQHPDAPFIRYLSFANTEVLVPNSLEAHKEVLQTQCYSLSKATWFRRVVKEMAGHGLILMEGAEHRAHRRMLTSSFSLRQLRQLEPIFREKARDVCRFFDKALGGPDDGSGRRTAAIDCTKTFSKAILDIMGTAILGVDLDYVKPDAGPGGEGKQKRKRTQKRQSDGLNDDCNFHDAYDVFFAPGPVGRVLLFLNGYVPTRWLPLKANRDFLFATDWLQAVLTKLIRDRYRAVAAARHAGKHQTAESRDLLTFIVEESLPGGAAEGIGETEFLGHLLEFMAAGHDTSANMLSWSLYIMATKHDVQDSVRHEMADLPDDPSFAELDRLPYLDNFVKECLRLYPPATTYHREADQDLVMEGIMIPKGTPLDICPAMLSSSRRIWGETVDEVDPTRWERLRAEQLSPYASPAFSNGPRICLGRHFALFEIKIMLVEMVRRFRFLAVDRPYAVENPGFTLRPAGLEVRLERVASEA